MIVAGLIFAAVAALIHIYIFYLESIAWESERARAAFGTGSVEEARMTKFMAFNQGFYNLFLALLAIVGIAAWAAGASAVGLTLAFAGTGSMLAAAAVLFIASRSAQGRRRQAGRVPSAGDGCLTIHLMI